MNDDFRPLLIPAVILAAFFTCLRVVTSATARPAVAPTTLPAPAAAAPQSTSTEPAKNPNFDFPEGLDADRIGYLVTVDEQFSQPLAVRASKRGGYESANAALMRLHYIERQPDGSYAMTREGLLNVTTSGEDAEGWTIAIGKRVFDKVTSIKAVDNGIYRASITWHWEATTLGSQMGVRPTEHGAVADFQGGDRHWALRWAAPLDSRF